MFLFVLYNFCSSLNYGAFFDGGKKEFLVNNSMRSFIPASYAPFETLFNCSIIVCFVLIMPIILVATINIKDYNILYLICILNCTALALVGILVKLSGADKMMGLVDPPFGAERYFFSSFTYKNHWSIFALIHILLIAKSLDNKVSKIKIKSGVFVAVVIFVLSLSIVLSGSRSCMLLLIPVLFSVTYKIIGVTVKKRLKRLILSATSVFVIITLLFTLLYLYKEGFDETKNVTSIYVEGYMKGKFGTRYMLTRDTWAMFMEKPIYGWGLGAYENVFNYYNGVGFKGDDHVSQHVYVFAHNDILQTLSELGLIGCTILGIPVILFYFGKIRFANLSSEIIWLLFVDALVIGYSLIEFPLRCPLILVILALVNANIVAYYSVNKSHIMSSS